MNTLEEAAKLRNQNIKQQLEKAVAEGRITEAEVERFYSLDPVADHEEMARILAMISVE